MCMFMFLAECGCIKNCSQINSQKTMTILQEISRESVPLTTVENIDLAWYDSILALRTSKGIQFYDFAVDLSESYDKKFCWRVSFIPTPKASPADGLISQEYVKCAASNLEVTQMVLDPALWPHNRQMVEESTTVSYFERSPVGTIYNNECVIAVLNNMGGVEIFVPKRTGWESKFNLTEIIKNTKLPPAYAMAKTYKELMEDVKIIQVTALCWGPKQDNGSCFLATSTKNGQILIWLINFFGSPKAEIMWEIPTEFGVIASLCWISKANHTFSLICSSNMGEIFCLDGVITTDFNITKITTLWPHKDRMVAKYLQCSLVNNKLVLLANKHRHLLFQLIDENSNIVSETIENVNDYPITSITRNNIAFYLSTSNRKMYELNFEISQDTTTVTHTEIITKDPYSTYEYYSLAVSPNGIIWTVGMIDRKINPRKPDLKMSLVFLTRDLQFHSELNLLLDNPTKQLIQVLDCLMLLRLKIMKQKVFPEIDYKQLYREGIQDPYKLKIYLFFLKLYYTLVKLRKHKMCEGILPEMSVDIVKEQIFAAQAIKTLNKLYGSCQSNAELLSDLQKEIYGGSRRYLEYFCQKYEISMEQLTKPSIFNLVNVQEYTCQGCDDQLKVFSCDKGHLNTFCSITFTLVDEDYIMCQSCKSIARQELIVNNPTCVFCDVYLNNYEDSLNKTEL